MRKIYDKDLAKEIDRQVAAGKDGAAIVATIKHIQDSSGLKVVQNVNKEDAAYTPLKELLKGQKGQ